MNNEIVSLTKKRIKAIFLVVVLFVGTIATISLSILTNIQAQPYYGMDNNNYEKSYGKNNMFDSSEKEKPLVYDENLQITQLTTEKLNFPTGIDFLAEDDILVIEKNTGQVKRIIDGKVLNEPVLDVNVASQSERGLLGIAILNTKEGLTHSDTTTINVDFQDENNVLNNRGEVKVFLFYTETKDIDNGEILGNRLYKYDFIDGKLVNPMLLLDLPFLPGPAHNSGVLELGPDNNLYLVVGDLYLLVENTIHRDYPAYVTLTQNVEDGKLPDGRGGVLRLTVDGDPFIENYNSSFSSLGRNSDFLDFYYGYGIRNSFGIGFDPLTGILWETENGPNYGDEINVILPGFNGGWRDVWGLSTEFEKHTNKEFDRSKLISLNGKGTYYDPVFTWAYTVAPTAITFIDSKIFGDEYENDILVGSAKQGGRIFHFNLNETRTGLYLSSEQLADKMANVDEELDSVTFGRNFGIITDIEINPYDGTIYVVDGQPKKGKIYQIYPKLQQQNQKQLLINDITTKDATIKNIIQQIEQKKKIQKNNNIMSPP